jgi:hypothetical protein
MPLASVLLRVPIEDFWGKAGVFYRLWEQGLDHYEALKGIKWEWQSLDGAMTKAPLGGEKKRTKSNRPS